MTGFSIDSRLLKDCQLIAQHEALSYLLHNNADVAWFILVPHTDQTEFYQLETVKQSQLCEQITLMSQFIKSHFDSDKINVATIGNVVSQMHVHVIGRRYDDRYWPDVVWGKALAKSYDAKQVSTVSDQLTSTLNLSCK